MEFKDDVGTGNCLLCCNPVIITNAPEEVDLLKQLYKLLNCPGMLSLEMNEGIRNSEFCDPCSRALIDSMNIFEEIKKLEKSLEEIREQMKVCIIAASHDDTNLKEGQTNKMRPRCLVRKTLALHLTSSGEEREGHDSEAQDEPDEDVKVKVETPEDYMEDDSYEGSEFKKESDVQHEMHEMDESRCFIGNSHSSEQSLAANGDSNNSGENVEVEMTMKIVTGFVKLEGDGGSGFIDESEDIHNEAEAEGTNTSPENPYQHLRPNFPSQSERENDPLEINSGGLVSTRITLNRTQHTCDTCDKGFATESKLNVHIEDVHSEASVKCEVCNKSFKSIRYLQKHKKSHDESRPRPFICQICGKGFLTGKELRQHGIVHLDESEKMLHSCDQCGKTYTGISGLRSHILRFHEKKTKHSCEICGKGFLVLWSLQSHMSNVHSERTVECEICCKSFKSEQTLKKHVQNVHQRLERSAFPCDKCKKTFSRKYELQHHAQRFHEKVFNHFCSICGKGTIKLSELKLHMSCVHSEGSAECDVCHQSFKSEYHMSIHKKNIH